MAGNVVTLLDERTLVDRLRAVARASGLALRSTPLAPRRCLAVRSAGLHLLTEGHLKLVRFSSEGRALILELLDPGDLFGEVDLASGVEDGQVTYAEPLTPVRFETLPETELERVLGARPALGLELARLMGTRRRRIERRLEAQIFQEVPTRLVHVLLELARRYGHPDPGGVLIRLPLSQQDLGGLIGASREIVSLTLNRFRRQGVVTSTRRRLVVRTAALSHMVEGRGDWGKNVTLGMTRSV